MESILGGIMSMFGAAAGSFLDWFLYPFALVMGTFSLQIASTLVGIASLLFEYAIQQTVVGFGGLYGEFLKGPVESVWTTFRDVSNIVIIGSFVFVAISTILGSENYGVRRFVARIIIAAVLINFSLFFTKLGIEVSHLFARQFHSAIETSLNASGGAVKGITMDTSGIAGALLKTVGVTNLFGTGDMLRSVGKESGGTFRIVLFSLMGSVLLMILTLVLGYGAFLLISRAVMLIFLMMTSSLAFAARGIPGLSKWWDMWLSALIHNVIFAPLLMMFLWATLMVALSLGGNVGQQGAARWTGLVQNPSSIVPIVLNFGIIIGMLIGSFYLAKKSSVWGVKHLPGDWKGVLAKSGGLFGGTVSAVGIQTAGRLGDKAYRKFGASWAATAKEGGMTGALANAALATSRAARSSSFNPRFAKDVASDIQKGIVKRYGLDTQGKGGVVAAQERKKKAVEEAKKNTETALFEKYTKGVAEEVRKEGVKKTQASEVEKEIFYQEAFQKQVETSRDIAEEQKEAYKTAMDGVVGELKDANAKAQKHQAILDDKTSTATQKTAAKKDLESEKTRITKAQEKANQATEKLVGELKKTEAGLDVVGKLNKHASGTMKRRAESLQASRYLEFLEKKEPGALSTSAKLELLVKAQREATASEKRKADAEEYGKSFAKSVGDKK